jgi:iron complex transport system ATP-binding protein
MLEANDITFRVANRELISRASISFEPGKLHLVIGPNGAGKSTLVKLLTRLLRPQDGSIKYDGSDVQHASEIDLAKRRAVLSQAVEVAFPLTVREVVMMGRYPHFGGRPGPADEQIVDEMMRFFDISDFATRDYQTLSGGERQRVNFARVLGQVWRDEHQTAEGSKTRYLFLDEPLTFLDIRHQIDFMKKIRAFSSAPDVVTVGVVHDLNLAARFADQIVLVDEGTIVASGAPNEVLTKDSITSVFGVTPSFLTDGANGSYIVFD